MRLRELVLAVALVGAALLACKPKSKINGTVTLNGSAFEVKDCATGWSSASFGGSTTTSSFVSLIDPGGNRIQISDSDHSVRVTYKLSSGASFADVGAGCGTLTFTTSPATNPSAAAGNLSVNCTGSGYHVVASASFSECGTYGL